MEYSYLPFAPGLLRMRIDAGCAECGARAVFELSGDSARQALEAMEVPQPCGHTIDLTGARLLC